MTLVAGRVVSGLVADRKSRSQLTRVSGCWAQWILQLIVAVPIFQRGCIIWSLAAIAHERHPRECVAFVEKMYVCRFFIL